MKQSYKLSPYFGCDPKEWKYIILPHNEVSRTVSMSFLATQFK